VHQRRRHVFHIAGYDPIRPAQQYRRFARELAIFQETWSIRAHLSEMTEASGQVAWNVRAEGANWIGNADYELLAWDDIVAKDAGGGDGPRLVRALVTYFDLLFTGTLFRYAVANTRYFLFALFPLFQLGALGFCSWAAVALGAWTLDLHGVQRLIFETLIGVGVFFALLRWPGRRWKVQHALDDWILARAYLHGQRSDVESRLDAFADRLIRRVKEGGVDEIVVVGHSLGALFAIEVVARALQADPDLGRRGIALCILTVGATIPKCTLHPAAAHIRDRVLQVAQEPSVYWAEYQARADAISFYRFDPVKLRRMTGKGDRLNGSPVIRRVQIQDMLRKETFARHRFRVLRLHYQFVMANNRRSSYDYFMMVCGPIAFQQWTTLPAGLLDCLGEQGEAKVIDHEVVRPA
jgi:pimeloyl-ACP methyl ester carboxylesterase